MIERKKYLDTLSYWKEKNIVKVVTGVRRCGKSTLLNEFIKKLKEDGVKNEQIISINLENLEFEQLCDYRLLYEYIKNRLYPDGRTYIFIDEIQQCKSFEKTVDSMLLNENADIYITGSNAYMLSGELATLLSGRYVKIDVLPFSFKEYFTACKGKEQNSNEIFSDYMRNGCFPYIYKIENDKAQIEKYIEGVYNTILLKDVAKREKISDISLLENVVRFLADSQGSPISVKKITDTLNSAGRKVSINTIDAYVRALVESYIFYKVDRFDVKGKMLLKTLGKYYMVDTGMRNFLVLSNSADLGHLLENIVYFELLRRYTRVNIGKLDDTEIDFVAKNNEGLAYYQVAATVLDKNVLERELRPLQKLSDNYPKFILTLDNAFVDDNFLGIKRINIIDWLLS